MSEEKNFVCICCPIGCSLTARETDGKIEVTGNNCKRGENYAVTELTAPVRTVTSTVKLEGGELPCAPVKTKDPIPKDRIFAALFEIKKAVIAAPVSIGDVALSNVAGTGVDAVVTRDIKKKG